MFFFLITGLTLPNSQRVPPASVEDTLRLTDTAPVADVLLSISKRKNAVPALTPILREESVRIQWRYFYLPSLQITGAKRLSDVEPPVLDSALILRLCKDASSVDGFQFQERP